MWVANGSSNDTKLGELGPQSHHQGIRASITTGATSEAHRVSPSGRRWPFKDARIFQVVGGEKHG